MHIGRAGNMGEVLAAAAVVGAVQGREHPSADPGGRLESVVSQSGWGKPALETPIDESQVSLITKELNDLMSSINCNLRFDYHKEVDFMSVRMIDKETNEVIKEIPPEEMIKNMEKAQTWIGAWLDAYA